MSAEAVAIPAAGVSLRGVTKTFGDVRAVDDVTLDLPAGQLTALLGPSGCGKSTLLRLIAGFERLDAGSVALGGRDVTRLPLHAREIGFVFQSYALFPHLTVADNVAFSLDVRRRSRTSTRARVAELLDLVRLPGYQKRYPHELSGGQRQRVALARALASDPVVLLLDEPFAALDANVRRELRGWLRSLHDEVPVTTLLVSHDAEEAMEIADTLVLMRDGKVEQVGAPLELYHDPVSPFALRFFGPANALATDGRVDYVRPHELRVEHGPFDGAQPARVARVVELGSRRRLVLTLPDGGAVDAELHAPYNGMSGVRDGDLVYYSLLHQRSFAADLSERS